jgi:hypothetical protein
MITGRHKIKACPLGRNPEFDELRNVELFMRQHESQSTVWQTFLGNIVGFRLRPLSAFTCTGKRASCSSQSP